MKLIVDNQLSFQLAVFLRWKGHDCLHVSDIGLERASDEQIWSWAQAQARVVVSKDDDFVFLANRPESSGQLIWVRLGNCRTPALVAAFDRLHDSIVAAINAGQRIVEVR